MTTDIALWPQPNPVADALLSKFLERAAPGWALRPRRPVSGDEVLRQLWKLAPMFEGRKEPTDSASLAELEVDGQIGRLAQSQKMDFHAMTPAGKAVLHARLLTAMTGAAAASLTPGPVMVLPGSLTDDQLMTAVAIRLLYQAPLSIAGLC